MAVLIKEALVSIRTTRNVGDSLLSSEIIHRPTAIESRIASDELIDATKEKVPGEV
jgi:hypothetical protein